jgi:uncharacterized protein YukE
MPPASVKITDEASTAKLISTFNDASQEQAWAEATLHEIHAELSGAWKGVASKEFVNGVERAIAAVQRIDDALNQISDDMQAFAGMTQTTEDDNQSAAANAALAFEPSWT